jgi:hypothetical protein
LIGFRGSNISYVSSSRMLASFTLRSCSSNISLWCSLWNKKISLRYYSVWFSIGNCIIIVSKVKIMQKIFLQTSYSYQK